MGRPYKIGIEYFSFDVDFFEDEKIEPISGEFGLKGEIITIRLLCAIYREGYFATWNERLKMTLANRCKVTPELVDEVVKRLVKWEFIDKDLFCSENIITSSGIQKRYKEATRKRGYDYPKLKYWLKNEKSRITGGNNTDADELTAEKTTQSKVNESKENNNNPNPSFEAFDPGKQPEKVPEEEPKKAEKKDFVSEIIAHFAAKFKEKRDIEYVISKGKDRGAAGKLINPFKKWFPGANSGEILKEMDKYFGLCLEIQDKWLYDHMSLSIIISQFNSINQILKNGNKRKNGGNQGATDSELAETFAKHFATDYTAR